MVCVFDGRAQITWRHGTFLIFLMNVMLQEPRGLMIGCNDVLRLETPRSVAAGGCFIHTNTSPSPHAVVPTAWLAVCVLRRG